MRFALVSLALAGGLLGCLEPVCTPAEHGRQCGTKPGTFITCEADENTECTNACWGGADYRHVEHACPANRSVCVDYELEGTPSTECLGEIIGSCSALGFVRCEGDALVECLSDHTGALVLSRGQCGPGTRCGQRESGQGWQAGCISG